MSDGREEIERLVDVITTKTTELDEAESQAQILTHEIEEAKSELRSLQSNDLDEDLFNMIEELCMSIADREERANKANQFIQVIASCGRRFFGYEVTSHFQVDDRGRIWFWDGGSGRKIYTHYRWQWKGFSEGGTLETLIRNLKVYIHRGTLPKLNLGPWPDWICDGDLWGYGEDMEKVREAAKALEVHG